uniref:RNase H type-1 domain-containing protein n=1 Tax=Brassica campestris TaxID=3711 RepID=M4DBT6_BRACM
MNPKRGFADADADALRGQVQSGLVDASWKSSREEMGFGWSLHRREGTQIMHGSSAEAPMNSTLEAEAIALLNKWAD